MYNNKEKAKEKVMDFHLLKVLPGKISTFVTSPRDKGERKYTEGENYQKDNILYWIVTLLQENIPH